MRRLVGGLLSVVLIVGAVFWGVTHGPSGTSTGLFSSGKEGLVQGLFAPQLDQVRYLGTQLADQFDAQATQKELSQEARAAGHAALKENEAAMMAALIRTLTETYTLQELKEKKAFERSDLAEALGKSQRQTLEVMRVVGKSLGRKAIVQSAEKEFSATEVEGLNKAVNILSGDTRMPDEERVSTITQHMGMDEQQARVLIMLLSLRQEDVAQEKALMEDRGPSPLVDGHIALARSYMRLTQIDKAFDETVAPMVAVDGLEGAHQAAREELAYGIARAHDFSILKEANAYFDQEIAQTILQKDLLITQKIAAELSGLLEGVNTQLSEILAR